MHRAFLTALIPACAAYYGAFVQPVCADQGDLGSVVSRANDTIKQQQSSVAQVPPVTQPPTSTQNAQLPTGFDYTLDFSVAKPFGDIGSHTGWLPGGMDATLSYGFNGRSRVNLNYFEVQHYPAGFNSGIKPLYLPPPIPIIPGVNPICADLTGGVGPNGKCAPINLDVTTKDRFFLAYWNVLVNVGKIGNRNVPVVISPTYVARWSKIAASPSGNDVVPFVDSSGIPHTDIHLRTAQVNALAFTFPFLKTPKMFGTFTVAPAWLVHTAGVNRDNHAQLYQILYLEYNPTETLRFFFEPQSSRDYLPADPYPEHNMAYFLGGSQRIGKTFFVQAVLNSGGPTNYKPYGVDHLVCFAMPCAANTLANFGGLKATQLQLQFGVGSPNVLQF